MKKNVDHESYGRTDYWGKKTSDNVSFLIDNKSCLCRHETLHPLTARKEKWVSEILYKDIENYSTRLT